MKWLAWSLYDYGTPILIAVLIACAVVLLFGYGKQILHEIRMLGKWAKAYADAIRKTLREEKAKSKRERRIDRLEAKEQKIRKEREALQSEKFRESIERMMSE